MSQAKEGSTVKVHYTGKLKDGSVFDSSEGREPLEFTIGAGMMISGFEKAVTGLQEGDKTVAELKPADAYGDLRDDLVFDFPKEKIPEDMKPEEGMQLTMTQQDGRQFPVTIQEVKDDAVVLDANHPLAGKDLIFEIEMMEVK